MTIDSEVAAVVLLRRDGAALLQHRDNKPGINHPDTWVPPGGHRDPDETIEACARREFAEETSYVLGDLHYLTRFLDDHGAVSTARLTVFWALYDDEQAPRCREGQDLQFVPRSRAAVLNVPPYLVRVWDQALHAAGL
jgi:8-oxo-dGTP pyrophosphatase MutT (NUDIX family)